MRYSGQALVHLNSREPDLVEAIIVIQLLKYFYHKIVPFLLMRCSEYLVALYIELSPESHIRIGIGHFVPRDLKRWFVYIILK